MGGITSPAVDLAGYPIRGASRVFSIITAYFGSARDAVLDSARSIAELDVPEGWAVEWLVQHDGAPDPAIRRIVELTPGGSYEATGFRCGVAATRNLALGRASGSYVRTLDDDDVLEPNAVRAPLEVLEGDRHLSWWTGDAVDLVGVESVPIPCSAPEGALDRGWAGAEWQARGAVPVHCAGLVARTGHVLRVGGWMALPRSEDIGLLVALSADAPGWHDHTVTFRYRRHAGQLTSSETWIEAGAVSHRGVTARARALEERPAAFDAPASD